MKFTIETKLLTAALSAVGIAANSRMTLPILGSVMIEAKDGKLTLSATNLDIFVTEICDAEIGQEGATVAAFKLLSMFLNRAASSRVALTIKDGRLCVVAGEMTAELETLPVEEFPPNLSIVNEGAKITIATEELLSPLQMVSHAMGVDESRYTLMGVCLKSNKNGTDVVATNGGLMGIFRSDIPTSEVEAILPADAVRAILRNIKGEQATLILDENSFAITSGYSEIRGKLIAGRYPNYEQVIPKENEEAFSAHRKELIEAIVTASLFLTQNEIDVSLAGKGKKELEVSCHDRFRHNLLGSDLEGQPEASIRFNHRFMKDTLAALKNDHVRIELPANGTHFGTIREGHFVGVIGLLADKSKA